jgi:hypothetical protein
MMRPRLVLLAVLAVLLPAGTALGSGQDVIRDCTDDEVMSKTYTQKEYRAALRELAADADQYGNCREVILRAQQAALAAGRKKDKGSGGDGGNDGGAGAICSAPAAEQLSSATKTERRAVERARTERSAPVQLDNASVDPGKVGTAPGVNQGVDLPTPLVIVLALLIAGTLVLGAVRIRRLVDARRA